MALNADFGVEGAAFFDPRLIDFPGRIALENLRRPFRRLQSAESRIIAGWIGTAQHCFDANEIFDRDGGPENRLRGSIG
jgi:hypothetical protein